MSTIELSENQKQKLLQLSKSPAELIAHRARLILAYAEGKATMQAAIEAGISRGRARYWKRQFLSTGMEIFHLDSEDSGLAAGREEVETHPETWHGEEDRTGQKGDESSSVQEEIPFPEPRSRIGVTSDDSLAEAGRKVWLFHFAIMLSHEQGTKLGEDIEELHDMRVATRRMRSAFDIFRPAFNPKIMKRYQKGLRNIGRALGEVRDMDVILEKGLRYQQKLSKSERPGLDPLINDWKLSIDSKRSKLIKHLQSESFNQFKRNFNGFLQTSMGEKGVGNSGIEGLSRIRDILPILVYSRYAAVNTYETILPTATVNQLHALRIEFKKFRYTLEYFKEILNDSATIIINEIKQYQDHLGDLHDADVACQLVRCFLKTWDENQSCSPIQERLNPEEIVSYLAYLHAERYRLMVSFLDLWQHFRRSEFRQNLATVISQL
jgi:CHAD domain-containing protein